MRASMVLVVALGLGVLPPSQASAIAPAEQGKDKQPAKAGVFKTAIAGEAVPYEGFQFRDRVNAVMLKRLDPAEGFESIAPVLAFCDAKMADTFKLHFSIQNDAEGKELAGTHSGKEIEWLDWACPGAYKAAAYLAIEQQDIAKALAFLDQAEAVAPLLAEPVIERGYVETRTGNPAAGVASYRRALALIEGHPGSSDMKAVALRGLGFSLIETGDLPGARKAYEQSLVVEPGNKLASDELDYLSGLEAAAAK